MIYCKDSPDALLNLIKKVLYVNLPANCWFSMTNDFSKNVREYDKGYRMRTAASRYLSLESVDDRIICLMRLLLAVSGLIITSVASASPDKFVGITYALLICYCFYSALLYLLARRGIFPISIKLIPWIDAAWYLVLVSFTNGTNSIFFFFFFFSILVAAFRSGFGAGLRLTVVCTFLFLLLGYATVTLGEEFELNRFLIRPVYFLMFGYLVSYWGGQEIKSKRHLTLLKDVNRLSNPRFGVDHTLSDILNRLRDFYDAESCILITLDSSSATYKWREASREKPDENLMIEETEAAAPLVKLPGELAILYRGSTKRWCHKFKNRAYNTTTGGEVEIAPKLFTILADLLEAESYFTVPVIKRGAMVGRLYLVTRQNCFDRSEIEFVSQLMEQVLTVVENVELLDRLASAAAGRQRQKISRDLHDSTIQPYIGLKLGLEALELKCAAGEAIDKDVEKLVKMTDSTIAELRGFVRHLQEDDEIEGNALISAVKQQVVKFHEFYNIKMIIQAADDIQLNDRLAAEAFQIISEGLSNIKRHTNSKNGEIRIYQTDEKLILEIENEHDEPSKMTDFVPKSITGRAESLGGTSRVERLDRRTRVLVEIPL